MKLLLLILIEVILLQSKSYADIESSEIKNTSAIKSDYSNYYKPFNAQSLWNSRPINPVLGDFVIPKSTYSPIIHEGAYSTGVFLAGPNDSSVTVFAPEKSGGIWDPDSGVQRLSITIPRWPNSVVPATGDDGHADIVDPITNKIHSFYRLKRMGERWTATHYAWTGLDGTGWADPAHFYQGVRAVSGPPSAGIVRKHEVKEDITVINHALALSLTFNALAAEPGYIYPATSADNGANENTGKIPEGALLMLPSNFDTATIKNPVLRKITNTLKIYGAYVVDRNHGTPFAIYVENGAGVNLHPGGWNFQAAADLDRIRANLRQVVATDGFIDGNGQPLKLVKNQNILSMRGPWNLKNGSVLGAFDTWQQAVVFGKTSIPTTQENNSGSSMHPVFWANPIKGDKFKLTSNSKGGAKLRLMILDKKLKQVVYNSGELADGQTTTFVWPSDSFIPIIWAISGVGDSSSVSGSLVKVLNE